MSQTEVAQRAGYRQQTLQAIESGQTTRPGRIAELAEALQTTIDWLLNGTSENLVIPHIIRPSGPEPSEVEKISEGWPNTGERTVNVRGVAVGGDDGFFYFGDVIDRVKRPPGIANAKDVEALNVAGESMVPRFGPGELIYIQLRPPAPGDDIVVELYPEKDGDQPKGFLKRLVRRTGLRLYCQQFNPPADIEFDMGEVKNVWRVLTLRDLLG